MSRGEVPLLARHSLLDSGAFVTQRRLFAAVVGADPLWVSDGLIGAVLGLAGVHGRPVLRDRSLAHRAERALCDRFTERITLAGTPLPGSRGRGQRPRSSQ